jgi:WD40 repeat protein
MDISRSFCWLFFITYSVFYFFVCVNSIIAQEEAIIFPQTENFLVPHIAFNPKGGQMANVSGLDTITIWDIENGLLLYSLGEHKYPEKTTNMVEWLEYSPNGMYLFFYDFSRTGKLINTMDWTEHIVIPTFPINLLRGAKPLAFSHTNNRFVAIVSEKKDSPNVYIALFDISSGEEIRRTQISSHSTYSYITFSPDDKYILIACNGEGIKIFDAETGEPFQDIQTSADSIVYNPDGKTFLAGSKLWDAERFRQIRTFNFTFQQYPNGTVYSPNGKQIATGQRLTISNGAFVFLGCVFDNTGNMLYELPAVGGIAYSPDGKYIVCGGRFGGAVSVYRSEDGKEIIQFVSTVVDNEWISITPDGYYNASPHGDEHINIRFGNEAYGIHQFSRAFYRPEVVQARLRGLPEPDVVRQFGDIRLSNAPPAVTVKVDESSAKITGIADLVVTVFDEFNLYPIDHIEVIVNGRLIGGEELQMLQSEQVAASNTRISARSGTGNRLEFRLPVNLDEGDNLIELVAANEVNYGVKTLVLNNDSGMVREKPDLWLLCIGINDYMHFPANNWHDLESAVGDARKIFSVFDSQQGKRFNTIHKIFVVDGEEKRPSRQTILDSMQLLKQAKPTDLVFLFIAAHGITSNGIYYFLPSDIPFNSDGELVLSKAINIDEILQAINIPGRKIVFIDTCESGGVDNNKLVRTLKNRSTVIFTAAQQNEFSNENSNYGGFFTHSIIEGMKGNATSENNITIENLGVYVSQRVTQLSRRLRNKQHPVTLIPDGYKDFVIAELDY